MGNIVLLLTLLLAVSFTDSNSITLEKNSIALLENENSETPTIPKEWTNIFESQKQFCLTAPIKSGEIPIQSECSSTDYLQWKLTRVIGGYTIQSKSGLFLENQKKPSKIFLAKKKKKKKKKKK